MKQPKLTFAQLRIVRRFEAQVAPLYHAANPQFVP